LPGAALPVAHEQWVVPEAPAAEIEVMIWGYPAFAQAFVPYETRLLVRDAQQALGFTETLDQVAARAVTEYVDNVTEMYHTLMGGDHVEGAPQEPAAGNQVTAVDARTAPAQ